MNIKNMWNYLKISPEKAVFNYIGNPALYERYIQLNKEKELLKNYVKILKKLIINLKNSGLYVGSNKWNLIEGAPIDVNLKRIKSYYKHSYTQLSTEEIDILISKLLINNNFGIAHGFVKKVIMHLNNESKFYNQLINSIENAIIRKNPVITSFKSSKSDKRRPLSLDKNVLKNDFPEVFELIDKTKEFYSLEKNFQGAYVNDLSVVILAPIRDNSNEIILNLLQKQYETLNNKIIERDELLNNLVIEVAELSKNVMDHLSNKMKKIVSYLFNKIKKHSKTSAGIGLALILLAWLMLGIKKPTIHPPEQERIVQTIQTQDIKNKKSNLFKNKKLELSKNEKSKDINTKEKIEKNSSMKINYVNEEQLKRLAKINKKEVRNNVIYIYNGNNVFNTLKKLKEEGKSFDTEYYAIHGSAGSDSGLIEVGIKKHGFAFGILKNGAIIQFVEGDLNFGALGPYACVNNDPLVTFKTIAIELSLKERSIIKGNHEVENPNDAQISTLKRLVKHLKLTYPDIKPLLSSTPISYVDKGSRTAVTVNGIKGCNRTAHTDTLSWNANKKLLEALGVSGIENVPRINNMDQEFWKKVDLIIEISEKLDGNINDCSFAYWKNFKEKNKPNQKIKESPHYSEHL